MRSADEEMVNPQITARQLSILLHKYEQYMKYKEDEEEKGKER
jgi:hypothetical protein